MKNKMYAVGAALLALACVFTQNAFAFRSGGSLVSFNTTNWLANSGTINSWPTNAATTNISFGTTNTVGALTGTYQYIGYVDHIGIAVYGFNVSSNVTYGGGSNTIGIGFVTAMCTTTPQLTISTNGVNVGATNGQGAWTNSTAAVVYNDWSSVTNWVTLTVPSGATSNYWFNIQTNFVTTSIFGDANWIGIASITNGPGFAGNAAGITNFGVSLNTKLRVSPFAP